MNYYSGIAVDLMMFGGVILAIAIVCAVMSLVMYSKQRYYRYAMLTGSGLLACAKRAAASSGNATALSGTAAMITASWTIPAVLGSSIVIAWGAEVSEFLVSQGMALAILAWLQVLPEFTVEAVIARQAALAPHEYMGLVTANFTGANRLLVGLGWPLIYFVAYFFARRKGRDLPYIKLRNEHSVEVIGLLIPTLYFITIWIKGTLNLLDSAILTGMYIWYLWVLGKMPPEDVDEAKHLHGVPKKIMSKTKNVQIAFAITMFVGGGTVLFFAAEPFVHSLIGLAVMFGISQAYLIQWVAPFLSEFPEKTSAFYWAKTVRHAPMALMNMISSKVNQWTILVAMIPMVFCATLLHAGDIQFNSHQKVEILLTVVQSIYAAVLLLKMKFTKFDAISLFGLWFIQFIDPAIDPALHSVLPADITNSIIGVYGWCPLENIEHDVPPLLRMLIIPVYVIFAIGEVVRYRKEIKAPRMFLDVYNTHVRKVIVPPRKEEKDPYWDLDDEEDEVSENKDEVNKEKDNNGGEKEKEMKDKEKIEEKTKP
ncbi:MAG: hypothetical protein QXT63_06005 [Thermoplasmata archaeon]